MKIFNRLVLSLILCSITLFANANDVGISLVSGSIEPLRNQLSFLFTFTWDDTSIDGMPEQSYFYNNADKKNASEQEKEWYSGKTIVSADFYRDSGIKWGLFALENAGATIYTESDKASYYLQVPTAKKFNMGLSEEERLVSVERAKVHYKIIINCDDVAGLDSKKDFKVQLSYQIVDIKTGEVVAELRQVATKDSIPGSKLSMRMNYTIQHSVKVFAEYLVNGIYN